MEDLEQTRIRKEKLQYLKDKGVDPFGSKYERTHHAKQIKGAYDTLPKEELESLKVEVSIAGRIMLKRGQGKAGFMHIKDRSGTIQIYVRLNDLGEDQYDTVMHSDLGDIVGVKGYLFRTNTD